MLKYPSDLVNCSPHCNPKMVLGSNVEDLF